MGQGSFAHKEAQDIQNELLRFVVPLCDHQTIHERFERQAAATPDAIAVSFEGERLTYRELNERANRLAHQLRALGVGPEVLVGLSLDRGIDLVIGILGILKAGGAYLPLDPSYPRERLRFMIEDAQLRLVLTNGPELIEFADETGVQLVDLTSALEEIRPASCTAWANSAFSERKP